MLLEYQRLDDDSLLAEALDNFCCQNASSRYKSVKSTIEVAVGLHLPLGAGYLYCYLYS
jgi:hypothetical protein